MKKRIFSFLLSGTLVVSSSAFAFASTSNFNNELVTSASYVEDAETRLNETFYGSLSTSMWVTIATDNNLFNAKVTVTNHAENPGNISFRIIDANGKVLSDSKLVTLGKSATSDSISAFAGKYTVQAKANSSAGTYELNIKD